MSNQYYYYITSKYTEMHPPWYLIFGSVGELLKMHMRRFGGAYAARSGSVAGLQADGARTPPQPRVSNHPLRTYAPYANELFILF